MITGTVKKHLGRGRQMGFPTANIDVPADAEEGIFLAWSHVAPLMDQKLPSLIFIGKNETFEENEKVGEVYILDFEDNLYGKEIRVEIIEKLRKVIKFSSPNTLIQQIHNDVAEARRRFKKLL